MKQALERQNAWTECALVALLVVFSTTVDYVEDNKQ